MNIPHYGISGKSHGRRRTILLVAAGILLCLFLLAVFFPLPLSRGLAGVCLVESQSHYEIPLDKGDTLRLYLPAAGSRPDGTGLRTDSAPEAVCTSGGFVSNAGHVVTSAAASGFAPQSLEGDTLRQALHQELARVEALREYVGKQLKELDYYARTHSVTDDGYTPVMEFREDMHQKEARLDALASQLTRALGKKEAWASLRSRYRIFYQQAADSGRTASFAMEAQAVGQTDSLLLLQVAGKRLPAGAFRFSPYLLPPEWWTARGWKLHVLGFMDYELRHPQLREALPEAVEAGLPLPNLAEGSPVTNVFGQLTGIVAGGRIADSRTIRRLVYGHRSYVAALFLNIKDAIVSLFSTEGAPAATIVQSGQAKEAHAPGYFSSDGRYKRLQLKQGLYVGQADGGMPDGSGSMAYADGGRYEGNWHKGLREGLGTFTDSIGNAFHGFWEADTLPEGTRRDSSGLYEGHFDKKLRRTAYGTYKGTDGGFYGGTWEADLQHGFGFAVTDNRIVQCGSWKKGKFQGEQMVYTPDRIYGIDISRYQHEIGKKRYGIDWSNLRINHLGRTSKKRIQGQADYPVSFVYIKATQGTTIRNRYYAADIRQARLHKIRTGAYHFFSTKCKGAAQAAYFLKNAQPQRGDLPPVLDIEPYDRQIEAMGGAEAMFREIMAWIQVVEKHCGTQPVLYVSQSFVNKYMDHAPDALKDYKVWIARYGEFKPYVHLLHWQLSCDGRVRGIHGDVDINVFNGTREQFKEYLQEHVVK